jgi:5,5'-dehydrodivanillate O-demethylase
MLTAEENRALMEVGPGTPMGDLMRRYWQPIASVAELDDNPIKEVRLLGEDLVLYRDKGGAYGLLDQHCPHRKADLSYGFVEDCGLRCNYHGWLFDETGRCLDQPFEETAHPEAHFKDRVTIKAYPVEPKAGLLWAYLGPAPAPLVPDWDLFHERGFKQIVFSHVPCNWFQCQDNSIDPVHFEWLHSTWGMRLNGKNDTAPRHLKIAFEEFDYGFIYRRVREDTSEEDEYWTVGRTCLWPNCLFTTEHFEWRVPIDDENTLSVGWFLDELPGDAAYEQERIPSWTSPIKDPVTGRWISSHVMNQDFIAWVGQGKLPDRTDEHLGESDRGIIMMRRRLMEQMELVRDGGEPKMTIRDPELNQRLKLPRAENRTGPYWPGTTIAPSDEAPPPFKYCYGQPPQIMDEMRRIWAQLRNEGVRA